MKTLKTALLGTAIAFAGTAAFADGHGTSACLITKTDTNPFFVKMREGAQAKAEELGITLNAYAGQVDGDNEAQVAAIETCIANGASGILITASDTAAIVPSIEQAREAGLLVIALDTPLEPIDAADATFATDNFLAGELIGAYAAAKMGDAAADAKIAMLDLAISQPTVGVLRDQGFLTGFGVDIKDPGEALSAIGRQDDVLIVSVDGGCPGVQDVESGVIGATSQQYPLLMASLGVEAIAQYAKDGTLPANSEGKDFLDTGVGLIAAESVDGVDSLSVAEGLELCWG